MTAAAHDLGVAIPQVFVDEPVDPGLVREFSMRAESLGFKSLWVMETGSRDGKVTAQLEPLTLLSYAAAVTTQARLGTSILLSGFRNPIRLSKVLATLDQLSQGRVTLGVGLGDSHRAAVFGIPSTDWRARFEEGLRVMQALWQPGTTDYAGRFWNFTDLGMEPKPVQEHLPIWFGAHAVPALRRAARMGDGWMGAGSSSHTDFVTQRRAMLDLLDAEERSEADFAISKRVYIAVDADLERAGRRVREFFAAHYRSADLGSRCAVWGPPDTCAAALRALRDEGARMLMLNPMFDHLEQLELLATEVLPAAE